MRDERDHDDQEDRHRRRVADVEARERGLVDPLDDGLQADVVLGQDVELVERQERPDHRDDQASAIDRRSIGSVIRHSLAHQDAPSTSAAS